MNLELDSPILDHDTFRQIVWDVGLTYSALHTLQQLLLEAPEPPAGAGVGLAMLLRGAEERAALALDALHAVSQELEIPNVQFLNAQG